MRFLPYIIDNNGNKHYVTISAMTKEDAAETKEYPEWQTSWDKPFFQKKNVSCYSFKSDEELIALGAYEVQKNALVVYIIYMEAQPESNPTITPVNRKYRGIGSMLIAYGIKLSIDNGFDGDVVLRAKTSELADHYVKDFGAVKLPSYDSSAPRYIIADEAAKEIFYRYLE